VFNGKITSRRARSARHLGSESQRLHGLDKVALGSTDGRSLALESATHTAIARLSYDAAEKRWLVSGSERLPRKGRSAPELRVIGVAGPMPRQVV
jgi:hypothetical protein